MAVKTKVVDTSSTNPAEFLAGGSAPEAPALTLQPIPGALPPDAAVNPLSPTHQPEVAIPEVSAPNRPGLEAPPTPELAPTPDPFVLLADWSGKITRRTLRAMPVPGGCIVRVSAAIPGNLSESICFVPGVKVENGQLVSA